MSLFGKKPDFDGYHDSYLYQYKQYIERLNTSTSPVVKNLCIDGCRHIKYVWTNKLNFDVAELEALEPVGIKI